MLVKLGVLSSVSGTLIKPVSAHSGRVVSVGDGVAVVTGLSKAKAGELVLLSGEEKGMVLNLERSTVKVVLFGSERAIGQMSFWGATVITNLFSAIPHAGESLAQWLWGGYSVNNATLNRFFSLHYLLPFAIAGMAVAHLSLLHYSSSNNPLGCSSTMDKIPMYPYFIVKDVFSLLMLAVAFSAFVFFSPNYLGHPDNYVEANALVTPTHIVPEWYFLPFYAILRAVPDKLLGVVAMGASIAILLFIPFICRAELRSIKFRNISRVLFWAFAADVVLLGYLGGQVAEEPFITISQIASVYYFAHFILLINVAYLLGRYLSRDL